jgi:hypothetical protein
MKTSSIAVLVLGLTLVWVSVPANGQSPDPCNRSAQKHKLKLIPDEDTKTITAVTKGNEDANELHVCRGDTVEWQLKGELEFYMGYFEDDPVLELNKVSKGGKVTTRVRGDAPRGKAVSYHVRLINGDPIEPVIVVD